MSHAAPFETIGLAALLAMAAACTSESSAAGGTDAVGGSSAAPGDSTGGGETTAWPESPTSTDGGGAGAESAGDDDTPATSDGESTDDSGTPETTGPDWEPPDEIPPGEAPPFVADGSALSDLAASLAPGEWGALPTTGLGEALGDCGSSGQIVTYSNEMEWDSGSKSIYFLGGDHNGCEKFIRYDALDNAWVVQPTPSIIQSCSCGGGTTQNHSYNYHALDEQGSYYYAYGYSDYVMHGYNIAEGVWDRSIELPNEPYYSRGNWSVEFTSHGLTLFSYETVWSYDEQADSWTLLVGGLSGDPNTLHVISQYNPFYQASLFGGGDGVATLQRLDTDANVDEIGGSPIGSFSIHPNPPNGVVAAVDPVAGDHIFFWSQDAGLYALDPSDGSWSDAVSDSYPFGGLSTANDLAAVAVPSYHVIIFVDAGSSTMWAYKHADP